MESNQYPTLLVAPPSAGTKGPAATKLSKTVGLNLDPWQANLNDVFLATNGDGSWASDLCALVVGRQNGKSHLILNLILAGALLFNETSIVYSAHSSKTVRDIFRRLKSVFEEDAKLSKRLLKVFQADGREYLDIKTTNGKTCRIEFVTRSKGNIRGFSAHRIILDEAQDLPDVVLESLLYAVSAIVNHQVIMLGTIPEEGSKDGEVLRRHWKLAEAGDETIAYAGWHMADGDDPDSREVWKRVNPAYGVRITEATIARERASSSEDGFCRERLSRWPSSNVVEVIPSRLWKRQELDVNDPMAEIVTDLSLALDVSHDRSISSVSAAGRNINGDLVVALLEQFTNPSAAVKFIREKVQANEVRAVIIDPKSQAGTLSAEFTKERIRVTEMTAQDVGAACGTFFDGITDGFLWHIGQVQLTNSLASARKRPLLGDMWAWNRRDANSDITVIVSATNAVHGVTRTKVKKPLKSGSSSSTNSTGSSQRMIVLQ